MVLGSGIDVMAVSDMERELAHGPWLARDGIFRASELSLCHATRSCARRLASYFVAKEAALKALDIHVADLEIFHDIEVMERSGRVEVFFHGRARAHCDALGVRRILAALYTGHHFAAAMVILEG